VDAARTVGTSSLRFDKPWPPEPQPSAHNYPPEAIPIDTKATRPSKNDSIAYTHSQKPPATCSRCLLSTITETATRQSLRTGARLRQGQQSPKRIPMLAGSIASSLVLSEAQAQILSCPSSSRGRQALMDSRIDLPPGVLSHVRALQADPALDLQVLLRPGVAWPLPFPADSVRMLNAGDSASPVNTAWCLPM